MGSVPGESGWILPAILALFVMGPGFWVLFRLLWKRAPELMRTVATIERIAPHFPKESPLKTQYVRVAYAFQAGRRRFEGSGVVPLGRFVQSVIPPGPVLIYDVRVNLPVLIADDTRVVGEEAIEHRLLQSEAQVRVCYLPADPAQNRVADLEKTSAALLSPSNDPG